MADILQSVGTDLVSATLAGGLVAPFVAWCDKAIAEAAAGQATVWESVGKSVKETFAKPLVFLKGPAFRCLWIMYGGTYAAANCFRSYEEKSKTSAPLIKTSSIFVVNCSLSLWKDSTFAKLFSGKPAAPVPKPALLTWYVRDFAGMALIFTAPPIIAKKMEAAGIPGGEPVAQIGCSLAAQPIQAPLHLYGYVLYNNPTATFAQQMASMKSGLMGAIQMRYARCIAPYLAGTNINTMLRKSLQAKS